MRLGLCLEPIEVLLTELCHFGRDHDLAVRLPLVTPEILLMVVLGTIEGARRRYLRNDRVVPDTRLLQFGDHLLGDALLLRRVVEDHRAVLRSYVRALTVQSGGIVDGE